MDTISNEECNFLSQELQPISAKFTSVKANGRLLDDVCSLRYDTYLANNAIYPNDSLRFFDNYDHQANCQSYLTYCTGSVVGTVRACVYKPNTHLNVPALETYSTEINQAIGFDQPFVESNMFVVAPSFRQRLGTQAPLALARNLVNSAIIHNVSIILIAVRPEHIRLFSAFSFEPISSAKIYPDLRCAMVLLACYDVAALSSIISSRIR